MANWWEEGSTLVEDTSSDWLNAGSSLVDEGKLVVAPSQKKDTSWLKAVAYGLRQGQQEAAKAADAYGIPRPKRNMADALADQAGLDTYDPAGPHVADSNASFGERASYLPRAMVEGIGPSLTRLSAAAVGGLPGLLGYSGAVNAPQAVETVTQDNGGKGMTPEQLARAAALTVANTGMDVVGTGSLMRPAKTALGGVGKAALGGAVDAASTDAANRAIGRGESPTLSDMALAGVAGAGTSAAMRAGLTTPQTMKEVADLRHAPENYRFRQFNNADPQALAAVAKLLQDSTGAYGKIKESNASDILNRARADSKEGLTYEAKNKLNWGKNQIENRVDELRMEGRTDIADAYKSIKAATKAGEPIRPEHRELLKEAVGGTEVGDSWLRNLDQSGILAQLSDIGDRQGRGGIHATSVGKTTDRVAKYFLAGSLGEKLVDTLSGHSVLRGIGLPIGLGAGGISLGMRGIDALSGYSNPVGRFARRYANGPVSPTPSAPTPVQSPVLPDGAPPVPPQVAPQTTPTDLFRQNLGISPGEAPSPSEMKLIGQILAKHGNPNMGPRPGESLTEATRVLPRGADESFRAPPADAPASPASLAKIDALTKRLTKESAQVEPSEAFKAAKAAALAKKAERDRLVGKVTPFAEPQKPVDAPKPSRPTRAISPMAEATREAPKPDMVTHRVDRWEFSMPRDQLTRGEKEWKGGIDNKVLTRKNFINSVKSQIKSDSYGAADKLLDFFMDKGTGFETARQSYRQFVDKLKESPAKKAELKALFDKTKVIRAKKHWEG
jgi:hypothetical protein